MKNLSIQRLFTLINALLGAMVLLSAFISGWIYFNNRQLTKAHDQAGARYRQTNGLIHNIDLMMILAKDYAATRDPAKESLYLRQVELLQAPADPSRGGSLATLGDLDLSFEEAGLLRDVHDRFDAVIGLQRLAFSEGGGQQASARVQVFSTDMEQLAFEMNGLLAQLALAVERRGELERDALAEQSQKLGFVLDFLILAILGLLVFSTIALRRRVTLRIQSLNKYFRQMARGDFQLEIKALHDDEIGGLAENINQMASGLKTKSDFVLRIGLGELDTPYKPLGDDDLMGKSLIEMRDSLRKAQREEAERSEQDRQRDWATRGLSLFAEAVRKETDLEKLTLRFLVDLVGYVGMLQGAIFLLDEEKRIIRLRKAYAYNRERLVSKEIELGEGIVGRCLAEAKTIELTEIPEGYVKIRSGLGDKPPSYICVVPILHEGKALGALELGGFHRLEAYQLDFLKQVCEPLASSLHNDKANQQNLRLLEEFRHQSAELAEKESVMRLSVEEMMVAQQQALSREEELGRKMDELNQIKEQLHQKDAQKQSQIEALRQENQRGLEQLRQAKLQSDALLAALNHSTYVVEYDLDGKILYVNDFVAKLMGKPKESFIGKNTRDFLDWDSLGIRFDDFWEKLRQGKPQKLLRRVPKENGKTLVLTEHYAPVFDQDGRATRVLKVSHSFLE